MKSKHLARADFLRKLKAMTSELYALGDSSCEDPRWGVSSSRLDGFIEAGLLLQVANRTEIQRHIDDIHFQVFGETREARRERKRGQTAPSETADQIGQPDWSLLDSPTYARTSKK